MKLPIQSEPVSRHLTTQAAVNHASAGATGEGVVPSEYSGVDASGLFDDILGGVQKAVQVGSQLAPVLASIPW